MVMDNAPEEQVQDAPQEEGGSGITDLTPEVGLPQEESYGGGTDEPQQGQPVAPQDAPQAPAQQDQQPQQQQEPSQEAVRAEFMRRQAEIDELNRRRAEEDQRAWQQDVARRAHAYQQQLESKGYLPDHAREQAGMMVRQEQQAIQSQQQTHDAMGTLEGRQMATLHFMEQYGLADKNTIDTIKMLYQTQSPDQMEREAARLKADRAKDAELAQLRQGQVQPQTFDNSQGSAEASTSEDRLINAYLNGDRSEAAVKAARNLTFGG